MTTHHWPPPALPNYLTQVGDGRPENCRKGRRGRAGCAGAPFRKPEIQQLKFSYRQPRLCLRCLSLSPRRHLPSCPPAPESASACAGHFPSLGPFCNCRHFVFWVLKQGPAVCWKIETRGGIYLFGLRRKAVPPERTCPFHTVELGLLRPPDRTCSVAATIWTSIPRPSPKQISHDCCPLVNDVVAFAESVIQTYRRAGCVRRARPNVPSSTMPCNRPSHEGEPDSTSSLSQNLY